MELSSFGQVITLISLAALLFLIAGLSFLGHVALGQRSAIARRVEFMTQDHAGKASREKRAHSPTPRQGSEGGLVALSPKDEAELIHVSRLLRLTLHRAPLAFLLLRAACGLVLATAFAAIGSGYAASVPLPLRLALFVLLGLIAGFYLPLLVLRIFAARRVQAVERGLPDAIELLVVSVEAGLALEDGIERIAYELRRSQGALAEELSVVAADLKLLPSQQDALMKFAERVDRPSVRAVMTTLAQTMRYGTPLAQALRVTAGELRNDMMVRLEERANRLPVLMTVPMILFLLPAIFLIVGGPAVLKLVEVVFR